MTCILLGVGASASIHKACDLASQLTQAGHNVRVIQTMHAAELVSPQLFEALTGQAGAVSEFGDARKQGMDHIELARWAEAFVYAPITAAGLARLAQGAADDLASTIVLALDPKLPKLLCPAMNPVMYAHPAVGRNIARCVQDGWQLMEPVNGRLACDEEGVGRLPEVPDIVARVNELIR
ncbi:MAG: phosphopantothenoylcysteine decarboxylase/phosphopantothenate--cysteine ligase [Candidatus Paceibacteria bacterium]|jgi:phosphopantothenoylcysteine decarboxylase/phosphopantothenate--cysteine ligase